MTALDHAPYLSVIHNEQFLLGYPVALASLLSKSYTDLCEGVELDTLRSWLMLAHIAVAAQDLGNRHVSKLVAYNANNGKARAGEREALRLVCLMMGDELPPAGVLHAAKSLDDEWLRLFLLCRTGGKAAELGDKDTLKAVLPFLENHEDVAAEYTSADVEYAILKSAYDGGKPANVCCQIKQLNARLRPRYCREVHQRFPERISTSACWECAKGLVSKR